MEDFDSHLRAALQPLVDELYVRAVTDKAIWRAMVDANVETLEGMDGILERRERGVAGEGRFAALRSYIALTISLFNDGRPPTPQICGEAWDEEEMLEPLEEKGESNPLEERVG